MFRLTIRVFRGLEPLRYIPFSKTREEAITAVSDFRAGQLLSPAVDATVKDKDVLDTHGTTPFRQTYLPFWTAEATVNAQVIGEVGFYYYVTVTRGKSTAVERRTRWVHGHVSLDGIKLTKKQHKLMWVYGDYHYNRKLVRKCLFQTPVGQLWERTKKFGTKPFKADLPEGAKVEMDPFEMNDHSARKILAERIEQEMAERSGSRFRAKYSCDDYRVKDITLDIKWEGIAGVLVPMFVYEHRWSETLYRVFVCGTSASTSGRPFRSIPKVCAVTAGTSTIFTAMIGIITKTAAIAPWLLVVPIVTSSTAALVTWYERKNSDPTTVGLQDRQTYGCETTTKMDRAVRQLQKRLLHAGMVLPRRVHQPGVEGKTAEQAKQADSTDMVVTKTKVRVRFTNRSLTDTDDTSLAPEDGTTLVPKLTGSEDLVEFDDDSDDDGDDKAVVLSDKLVCLLKIDATDGSVITFEEVRRKYLLTCIELHPDHADSADAKEAFIELREEWQRWSATAKK
eukprot:TRINITY_DN67189_c7_g1_i2.p1 TRINITY_DN67189_c7_g1~~TRINITY_DN67189_c7_g1_i2.p1  ORF type:complete len:508 (-),score=65.94 TRINITY_DN67189_c7_g1_i2:51-1574(-)